MIDFFKPGTLALLLIGAAFAGWLPASAQAQEAAGGQSELDCVIEARQMVELGSSEQGVVKEITVKRGDVIEIGAVLARLDSEIQTLAVELARQRAERTVEIQANSARLEYRRREIQRLKKLHEKDIVSTKSLDEAEIERRLAVYNLAAARIEQDMARTELRLNQARLDRRTIRSPVDGVVVEVSMAPGELVHDQSQLMKIAVVDPLNVEVYAPIAMYGTIKRGMLAEVLPDNPVGGLYKARVAVVDRVLDTASDTFGVRLELPNSDHWIPAGLRCRVRFLLDAPIEIEPEQPRDDVAPSPDNGGVELPQDKLALPAIDPDDIVSFVQSELGEAGYDAGPPDGVMGPQTETAIRLFQERKGLPVDGKPSLDLLKSIRSNGHSEPQN